MSPLACSLVALAALFAVSDARGPRTVDPFCSSSYLGDAWGAPHAFKLTVSGGDVEIPDRCKEGRILVGQDISVCNSPNSNPEVHPFHFGQYPFKKVYIDCPHSTRGCSSLEVKVTQYCYFKIGHKG
ncbi:uncharacterized protein LOC133518356 [Cydia pomonella]|uniref:uncharacterized protein LOC133518356 n=1 Tax=Cydia pomonella TaxID=82600 RepID=UPI002ADE64D7|nr:uncharacterized protein LOC133518356 [Cydia pomonella]